MAELIDIYKYFHITFNINKSKLLIKRENIKTESLDVTDLYRNICSMRIDKQDVENANLHIPIIIATIKINGDPVYLLIDGNHRVTKAFNENQKNIQGYVLTYEQSLAIIGF